MKANDGGPAFPLSECRDCGTQHESVGHKFSGMSLRDWFAGQVSWGEIEACAPTTIGECAAVLGIDARDYKGSIHYLMVCAVVRYRIADAMLAHRAKEVADGQ